MSGGGGGQTVVQPSTTTTVQDIPAWEQGYVTDLLGQAQTVAAQPYQQFPGQQVAGFTNDQNQAFSNIEGQQASINPLQSAATGQSNAGANTANGIYGAGSPYLQASTMAASPQGIQAYMSPYTNDVVQGLQNTANQNWNQNIMPSVNNEFVGSGQYGSGRNAQVLGQAANNFQTNLNSSVANALESGYTTAGNQAATEAGLLGNAGTSLGNLAATQGNEQLASGANLQNIANSQNSNALTNSQALQAVGQQQQQLNQTNLNTAQQNWQNQVNYPAQQTEYLNQIIRGLPAPTATTSASQSPAYSVSPLSGIGGAGAGALALTGSNGTPLGTATGLKRGGLAKYAEGGAVYDDSYGMDDEPHAPLDYIDDDTSRDIKPAANPLNMSDENAAKMAELYPDEDSTNTDSMDITNQPDAKSTPINPLSQATASSSAQTQQLQLLALAKGLLTPQMNGDPMAALGQGFGNLADVTMKQQQVQAAQNALNYQRQQEANRLNITQQHYNNMDANRSDLNDIRQQLADAKANGTAGTGGVTERLINEYMQNNPDASWNDAYSAVKRGGGNNDDMNNIRKETLAQNAFKSGIPIKGNSNPTIDDYRQMYGVKSTDTTKVNSSAPGNVPTQVDIDYLKQNPAMASRFEGRFGSGTAEKYLGQ